MTNLPSNTKKRKLKAYQALRDGNVMTETANVIFCSCALGEGAGKSHMPELLFTGELIRGHVSNQSVHTNCPAMEQLDKMNQQTANTGQYSPSSCQGT